MDTGGDQHAFSWTQAGGMVDLGALGGTSSHASAVSNGQVVGYAFAGGAQHAFSWTQGGGMVDLGTLGGTSSQASAVSNGQVVGNADTPPVYDVLTHAFSWTPAGGMVDLGTPPGATNSSAVAVSNGQVVGNASDTRGGVFHAVLWTAGQAPPCVGDCDGSGDVTVNELITMVNIALGNAQVSACPIGDADGSGDITVNEIIKAVGYALGSCPG